MTVMHSVIVYTIFLVSFTTSDKPHIERHLTKNGFHRFVFVLDDD